MPPRKTTKPKAGTKKRSPAKKTFDGDNAEHWQAIPSKGMLFKLAIFAFEGHKFEGSEIFGSRDNAKKLIKELSEQNG